MGVGKDIPSANQSTSLLDDHADDDHADDESSISSSDTQTGVRNIEAVSQTWTKWSLIAAYAGYVLYMIYTSYLLYHHVSCLLYSRSQYQSSSLI